MDLEYLEKSLVAVSICSLMLISCLLILCILLAAIFLVLCLTLKGLTAIFEYSGNDLWEYLEAKHQVAKHKSLLSIVNCIAKFQTSEQDKNEQIQYLKKKEKLVNEANERVQREVFLAEEIDRRRRSDLALHPATQSIIDDQQAELKDLSSKLHENWKKLKGLSFESPGGAWIRDYNRTVSATKQGTHSLACAGRGGCCAFGCGCCERIRAFGEVPKERPAMYLYSHCTITCACCHQREIRAFRTQEKSLI